MGSLIPKISDDSRRVILGQQSQQLNNNEIQTTKYSILTFLPKSLFIQFYRISNIVFLVNAILQSIPIISNLSPITAIGPLGFVLAIGMLREGFYDYKRHRKDQDINSRKTHVLRNGRFQQVQWRYVKVGDYIKILRDEQVPADILLLYSTQENSICYVETSNLDGENNLKEKHAFTESITIFPHQFGTLHGYCLVDAPRANLYDFQGQIVVNEREPHFIGFNNLLLRETAIRNTQQIVGVAIYCGFDSKILKNQGYIHHKISQLEKMINYIQILLMLAIIIACGITSGGYYFVNQKYNLRKSNSYVPTSSINLSTQTGLMFFTALLLFNFLIPIALNILLEGIKVFIALFLWLDRKLYDPQLKKRISVLNNSIVEELGVVDYILTDKTGTLTANQMVFKTIALQYKVFTEQYLKQNFEKLSRDEKFVQFWLSVVLCHDVVKDHIKGTYQGSSPDEVCFINYAHSLGYTFMKRTKNSIEINMQGEKIVFQILEVIHFTQRKRMSVIVRNTCGRNQILMFTKGADNSVFSKSIPHKHQTQLEENLNVFAKQGLRTLLFSQRQILEAEFKKYMTKKDEIIKKLRKRIITKEQYNKFQQELTQSIQNDLQVLGATGIEDKLQEGVPQAISRFAEAGIKVMMITGDKLETAENIGYLAQFIKPQYKILHFRSSQVASFDYKLKVVQNQVINHTGDVCVVFEGQCISKLVQDNNIEDEEEFKRVSARIQTKCSILKSAKSVIFCRSSPKQKAEIVKFVKKYMQGVVLAIGDGGNDIGMIEQAHIGVGIIGKEGNLAAAVSDFCFGKFRFLDRLVLHHGRWFYYRFSYFFVYFGWKNVIITLMIFLYMTDSAYSGGLNFSELTFVIFNSFFAIPLKVYLTLYDQDINDDLHPQLHQYLPYFYSQAKEKKLFSYKRYGIWTITGCIWALILYYSIRFSFMSVDAIDSSGRIPDIYTARIANGLATCIVIHLVILFDMKTHTYFYQFFIVIFCTVGTTTAFFISENYISFLESYLVYSDNFNMRFWFLLFFIFGLGFLSNNAIGAFWLEYDPTLIDIFYMDKMNGTNNLEIAIKKYKRKNGKQSKPGIPPELNLTMSLQQKTNSEMMMKKASKESFFLSNKSTLEVEEFRQKMKEIQKNNQIKNELEIHEQQRIFKKNKSKEVFVVQYINQNHESEIFE